MAGVFFPFYFVACSKIPAFLNVVDIAGLVRGAHAGQGLGNAFLSHISACDGIFHLTRESRAEGVAFPHSISDHQQIMLNILRVQL